MALEQRAEILRDGHGTHRTDVGAAGVPDGNPHPGEERGGDDANRLTEDLSRVSCTDAVFEHQPMHPNVAERKALAEDVRAFQVVKRTNEIVTPRRLGRAANFDVDCLMKRVAHRSIAPTAGRHRRAPLALAGTNGRIGAPD